MPHVLVTLNDKELELWDRFRIKYGVKLPPAQVRLLSLLMSLRVMTFSDAEEGLWPEEWDKDNDADLWQRIRVHMVILRNKLGSLIDVDNLRGQGYALRRLGPEDNPIFERK